MRSIDGFTDCDLEPMSRLFFDKRDYNLLRIVNDILRRKSLSDHKRLLGPYLHPHGIKEMAAPQALRIAYAVAHLLGSLEIGEASDRLSALRSLKDEVFYSSQSGMRINTARVLIEIMKNLIRAKGDCTRQLMLAHDFNAAASGRPRIVRDQLAKHHLIEMPEEWNQVTFDDHVHDANTKGRKSPTHLIMDAWIKGIRCLTVVYYNYVPKEAARELLEAGEIMGTEVRIGFEFFTSFRSKTVQLICSPQGISDAKAFVKFLSVPAIEDFMEEGRQVALRLQAYILEKLQGFNKDARHKLNRAFGVNLPSLEPNAFLAFVGSGQASIHHLGKFIHESLLPLLEDRLESIKNSYAEASPDEQDRLIALVFEMDSLSPQRLIDMYLRRAEDDTAMRALSQPVSPNDLLQRITSLHPKARTTLNLSRLQVEDVLEILYDCKGLVTHLEIVNLKNIALGRNLDLPAILDLQEAINSGSVIKLKKCISGIVDKVGSRDGQERKKKLLEILCDLPTLQSYYQDTPLMSCVGSDSTGQSGQTHGMGFVLIDSLPKGAQKQMRSKEVIPLRVIAFPRYTVMPRDSQGGVAGAFMDCCRMLPGLSSIGFVSKTDWVIHDFLSAGGGQSNIYMLGGVQQVETNGLTLEEDHTSLESHSIPITYLKTSVIIGIKILLGFIPAFLTFALTSDWWLLAYGGAIIWFAITGLRNVIQSVLGCGGIHRSSLIRWNSLVSWNRMADSLLYSGISVPLLEYVVKIWLMEKVCGITVASNPVLLYAAISLVNGFYLLAHNLYRGLPKAAAYGNLFRSIINIPLSIALNDVTGEVLLLAGIPAEEVVNLLQKWAAILSKLASDGIAGIIEGVADKFFYMRMRSLDYTGKMKQVLDTCAQIEIAFPQESMLSLLESPNQLLLTIEYEQRELADILIVNALDLLYFWMCQPRARDVFKRLLRRMTQEERRMILLYQHMLSHERHIGKIFIDGLIGRQFSKTLAFYLNHWRTYVKEIYIAAGEKEPPLFLENIYSAVEMRPMKHF